MITMGGNAEIELIDSMDPFSEGALYTLQIGSVLNPRCRPVYHAAEKVVASNRQSVGRREDFGFPRIGLRASRLQADSSVLYGRD